MRRPGSLAAYTYTHAAVDLCCAWAMLRAGAAAGRAWLILLFYHLMAFGLQAFFGMLLDRRPGWYQRAAILGCFLTAAGTLLAEISPAATVFCGLGNALFHVGGGVESLRRQPGMGRSGVFVSGGAVGLALGILWGGGDRIPAALPVGLLFIGVGLVMVFGAPDMRADAPRREPSGDTAPLWRTLALCSVSIAIRSFVGFTAPMPWKSGPALILTAAVCAALGKALGGLAADRLGPVRAGTASLLLSAPLLAFGGVSPVLGCAGLVLFNMTMAVTLCLMADRLPGQEGCVFGLTTLALLAGYFPATGTGTLPGWGILLLVLGSAACLWFAEPGRWKA